VLVELRDELETRGRTFRTTGDTEVVAHAFDEWGRRCFERFNGMWALAVYDPERQELTLSRDRFGVKPLYYHHNEDGLTFGSELKLLAPLVELGLDEQTAAEFIAEARIDHSTATLHPGVVQVEPGAFVVYDHAGATLKASSYWTLPDGDPRDDLPLEQAIEEFGALFNSAVDVRMRSDVPVGSLLSGGLDSTAIVTNLHSRGRFPDGGFRSFSAVYAETEFSERSYIEATAAQSDGLDARYLVIDPDRLTAELPEVIRAQDAPFRSLAVYCQWLLYRDIRASSPVVVLLNGQGSDEAFGGYTRHLYSLLGSHAIHGRLGDLARDAAWLHRNRGAGPGELLLNVAAGVMHGLRGARPSSHTLARPWLTQPLEVRADFRHRDPFENNLRSNLRYSALPEYLRYEDRNSMSASLETRLPFLDYRLVEWAATLPARLKIHRGESKRVVRRATAGYVPEAVRARTDKMGFTSPQERWQRDEPLAGWVRDGIDRLDLATVDGAELSSGYDRHVAHGGGDPFVWFRAACTGWWQELRAA